jgi:DNA-binding NarL/FixJ family response regulator
VEARREGSTGGAPAAKLDPAMAVRDEAPNVLVVDDDPLFRDAVAMTLTDAGYRVTTATNARSGAILVARDRFDAVIADIQMAGNDRLQWLHELASSAPGLPIVVVTGHPSLRTAISAVRLPVVAYLVKPVAARDLVLEVAKALSRPTAPVDPVDPNTRLRGRLEAHRELWCLTPRQCDVLECVAKGASNKEIAETLGCALRTVELHVSNVLRQSGHESRAALVARFWSQP